MRWHAAFFLGFMVVATAAYPAEKDELVYRIDNVSATMKNHRLVIHAEGAVRTGGWTKSLLRIRAAAPAGRHILTVEFRAAPPPPGVAVIPALLPVTASVKTMPRRSDILAVRVISQTNEVTAQILK